MSMLFYVDYYELYVTNVTHVFLLVNVSLTTTHTHSCMATSAITPMNSGFKADELSELTRKLLANNCKPCASFLASVYYSLSLSHSCSNKWIETNYC